MRCRGDQRQLPDHPRTGCRLIVLQDGIAGRLPFKNHLGLFPPVSDPALLAKVAEFAGPKGNLQFPYAKPIPLELIAAIVKSRIKANAAKDKPGKSGVA